MASITPRPALAVPKTAKVLRELRFDPQSSVIPVWKGSFGWVRATRQREEVPEGTRNPLKTSTKRLWASMAMGIGRTLRRVIGPVVVSGGMGTK